MDRQAEVRRLLLRAEVVVLGSVSLGACRDGCQGRVVIEEVLAGSASGTLGFISAPPLDPASVDGRRLIVFLARDLSEPGRWRALLTDGRQLGLEPQFREQVLATKVPRATNAQDLTRFAPGLEALRRHRQDRWGPDSQRARATAQEVFSELDFRGLEAAAVIQLLGEPARRHQAIGREVWEYTFHDGEQGVLPQFWFSEGIVAAVVVWGSE